LPDKFQLIARLLGCGQAAAINVRNVSLLLLSFLKEKKEEYFETFVCMYQQFGHIKLDKRITPITMELGDKDDICACTRITVLIILLF